MQMNIIRVEEEIAKCEERQEKIFKDANLGERFKYRTFDNFEREKQQEAYDKAIAYVSNFKAYTGKGLLFLGTVGTGKTHLAAAITHYMAEHGVGVKFGNIVDIFESARNAYSTDEDIIKDIKKYPLLVIDDLGKERSTEWTKEKLYEIVNYRYERCLPMVFTTNLTSDELEERLGDATMSRIREMCTPIKMVGKDMRK